MKKRLICFFALIISLTICSFSFEIFNVKAESLNDNINEQLENIDLSELESFYNSLERLDNVDFFSTLKLMLSGNYTFDSDGILNYIKSIAFNNFIQILSSFITVVAISLFCGVVKNMKSNLLSDGVTEVVFYVCFLSVVLIISSEFISIYNKTKNTIENLSKLNEIMSPILLVLMVATGGNSTISVFKPATVFFSNGVVNIISLFIIPLVGVMTIFSVLSNLSPAVKISKFSDFFASIIKWVLGIIIIFFGVFITIQGITSSSFDGLSIKVAKYAISNSVPIVGGLIKDGFDIVVAGSLIIKNSLGVIVVFTMFYIIISPVLYLVSLNLVLKLVCAVIEPISDVRICNLCNSFSKSIGYLIAIILVVGLMMFLTVFLMIISANAFLI